MSSDAIPALKTKRSWRHPAVYAVVALCWIAYLAITFSQQTQTASNVYKLADWQLNLLRLTIAVPYLLIWLAAFHGALQIRTYQASLGDGQHRLAFRRIYRGLAWLAVGLLATTFVGSLRNLSSFGGYAQTLTILNNFLYVLFPLIGFSQLFMGSGGLAKEADAPLTVGGVIAAALAAAAVAGAQLYLIFTDPMRGTATYHLSDPLVIGTIALPTAASIVLSVITAFSLRGFLKKSAAVIYEKSFPPLINGLLLIMASTIILQLLLSLGQSRLLGIGLAGILVVVYLFLAVQAVGYLLVARGTGRLAKLQRTLARYQADAPQP